MATYAVTDTKLTAIADAIRLKRDTAEEFSVDDMPLAISLIEGGGGVQPVGSTYTDIVVEVECPSVKEWMALLFDSMLATGAPKIYFGILKLLKMQTHMRVLIIGLWVLSYFSTLITINRLL